MSNKSVSITPTFAPETEFQVQAKSDSWRLDLVEVQQAPVAEQIRPLDQQLFEKSGIPFSALND